MPVAFVCRRSSPLFLLLSVPDLTLPRYRRRHTFSPDRVGRRPAPAIEDPIGTPGTDAARGHAFSRPRRGIAPTDIGRVGLVRRRPGRQERHNAGRILAVVLVAARDAVTSGTERPAVDVPAPEGVTRPSVAWVGLSFTGLGTVLGRRLVRDRTRLLLWLQ